MTDERRRHERFELLARIDLRHSSATETCVTINISAGGVLLRNDRNFAVAMGDRVRIGIDAPELAPAFTIDAIIVRAVEATTKPGLIGAMWASSDAAASAALNQVLWNLRKLRAARADG
ncbi:MAG: PilZ domain-containing protein [Kofleriaceae bacterium]|jgi:hypothetical protein|nr:PilZ domain-containing protein [Kofleriaceae bacterium]MBP9203057.1 PilZ domain-containing protein [Kofleriaceae bacterium]